MVAKGGGGAKGIRSTVRKNSLVQPIDQKGNVYKGFHIWSNSAPGVKADPSSLVSKCLVMNGSTQEVMKCKQIDPHDPSETEFEVKQKDAHNYNSNLDPLGFPDIGMIPHTNDACVLDFFKQRLVAGQIFTTADPLLVVLNPFKDLKNATDEVIRQYRDARDHTKLPPHVFATARTALEALHEVHKSQTIIVSGESGAGKTEATKQIMRYFAAAKKGTTDTRIQQAVMAANPVLEAFGNAKTIRNNNSSRFGRFMRLQVAKEGGIEFGSVENFLLEKSRVITQEDNERSYHIFYQFLKGATDSQKKTYKLLPVDQYKYINPKCLDAPGIDDIKEWKDVCQSFLDMGRTEHEIHTILSLVSGVLLLGNVEIAEIDRDGMPGSGSIAPATEDVFKRACELLFIDAEKTRCGICDKISIAGGKTIQGVQRAIDSEMLRSSLAKAVYDELFNWIVKRLNSNIEPTNGFKHFMAMLDIFGFEVFANNSLEQMFINITNERLQKNFVDVVFEKETRLYREEGISSADLEWTTNEEVIKMLTARRGSFMSVLAETCIAPGAKDETFLLNFANAMQDNPKFIKAKVGGNRNFIVDHTVGEIQYNVSNFLFKNKDVLVADLAEVLQQSDNDVVKDLFVDVPIERGTIPKDRFIGSQFGEQLEKLMGIINETEPHFIRCVKPNEEKEPLGFDASKTLIQLHALSIIEALQLRNLGYSYRRPYHEFLFQYKYVDIGVTGSVSLKPPVDDAEMEEQRKASKKLLENAKVSDWQIGKTMTFMKPETMKALSAIQKEKFAAWEPIAASVSAAYMRKSRLEYYYENGGRENCSRMQAICRRKITGQARTPSVKEAHEKSFHIEVK